jgi:hypothetical protein
MLELPLPQLARLLHSGEVHPRDLVAEIDSALSGLTPAEHGFAHIDLDFALAQVEQLDTISRDKRRKLWGIPIPVKDLSPVVGMPVSYGSVSRREIPDATDPFPEVLLNQGALIPGKTQTPELGMSAYTEPVGMPAVDNPRLPGHTPGGSSGGAAAAVARGVVRVAHASDGGGSIRIPAASTGLVGFKPPHLSHGAKLTVQGFLVPTLADTAFLHNITPCHRALRVGVLVEPLHGDGGPESVAPHVVAAVRTAADKLSDLGHSVVEVRPAYGPELFSAFQDVLCGMARRIDGPASSLVDWLRSRGMLLSAAQRADAVRRFHKVGPVVRAAWDIDVLLTPTLAFDPPAQGFFSALPPSEDFEAQTRWTPWATLFNMTGGAALSIPFGTANPHTGWQPSVHLGGIRCTPADLFGLAEDLEQ